MATFVKPDDTIKSQEVPRDAKIIALILKSMGVEEYEPRVINQLLEFMHSLFLFIIFTSKSLENVNKMIKFNIYANRIYR